MGLWDYVIIFFLTCVFRKVFAHINSEGYRYGGLHFANCAIPGVSKALQN